MFDRNKMNRIFEETGADAVLVTDPYNMRYLSGFSGGEGILFISPERTVLITDSRYTEAASKESAFEVIEENRSRRRIGILSECIDKERVRVLGFEDTSMRYSEYATFSEKLTQVKQWIPLGSRLDDLRQIKTPEELELLAKAEAIGDAAFKAFLGIVKTGMTELEAAAELEYQMKKNGAEGFSFDTIMASGKHSSMPHAVPTEKKLEAGEMLTMDFGCIYRGYCSDMTRTIALCGVGRKEKEVYDIVLRAQRAALSVIRAGVTGEEVDAAARNVIAENGYGDCFGHATGHSVGLFIHESPRCGQGARTVLRPGMIETVEPGIYLSGEFGVRIEDMVAVTENGCRNLTSSPKELIVIG